MTEPLRELYIRWETNRYILGLYGADTNHDKLRKATEAHFRSWQELWDTIYTTYPEARGKPLTMCDGNTAIREMTQNEIKLSTQKARKQ